MAYVLTVKLLFLVPFPDPVSVTKKCGRLNRWQGHDSLTGPAEQQLKLVLSDLLVLFFTSSSVHTADSLKLLT